MAVSKAVHGCETHAHLHTCRVSCTLSMLQLTWQAARGFRQGLHDGHENAPGPSCGGGHGRSNEPFGKRQAIRQPQSAFAKRLDKECGYSLPEPGLLKPLQAHGRASSCFAFLHFPSSLVSGQLWLVSWPGMTQSGWLGLSALRRLCLRHACVVLELRYRVCSTWCTDCTCDSCLASEFGIQQHSVRLCRNDSLKCERHARGFMSATLPCARYHASHGIRVMEGCKEGSHRSTPS